MFRCLAFCSLLCLMSATSGNCSDWPQWRGPNRDGTAIEPGLTLDWKNHPPQLAWMIDGMGEGYASVSIADGRLLTTGNFPDGQSVVCVGLEDHNVLWRTPITSVVPDHDYPGSRCTPTIDGNRCYAMSSDGMVACLDVDSGKIVWKVDMKSVFGGRMMSGWGFSESPLVDGDRVIVTPGAREAMLVALNKKTGREIWRTAVPDLGSKGKDGAGYSSVVISNGGGTKQYVQMVGRGLIGVRASDGKLLWNYNPVANNVANIPTPICTGDYVFASTGYQAGACLLKLKKAGSGIDAEEVYFLNGKTFQNHHGGMILSGDYIYAGHRHGKGFPICVHLPTGTVRWGGDFRPPGGGSAAVTRVNDQLLFRYEEEGIIALIAASPDGYELQGTFQPEYKDRQSWSHPVVVGRTLYLREQGKLMCYQL